MSAPAMTFSTDELLDRDRMKNGPMTVFWNQDDWVRPSKPLDYGQKPKPKLWQRLLRLRLFKLDIRLMPPEDADLLTWGKEVAAQVGVPWQGEPEDGDKAVWLVGACFARNPAQVVGGTRKVFDKMPGRLIRQAQVQTELWR